MRYFLSREDVARHLDESLQQLASFLEEMPPTDWKRATDNEEWTLQDTLAHLASSGWGLLGTAQRFLDGWELPETFDLDLWNRRQVQKRRATAPPDLLNEIREAHEEAKRRLFALSDEELLREGTHPIGQPLSVIGIFYLISQHELDHLGDMAAALGRPLGKRVSFLDPFRKERLWHRLEGVRGEVRQLAASLSAGEWGTPVTDTWTVKDVYAHLGVAEQGHMDVGWALLRGESTQIEGFDLDTFNNETVAARRHLSVSEVLAELNTARSHTAALLDAVTAEDWSKGGPHPGGFDVTVEGIFKVIALHERRHLREVRQALGRR